LVYIIIAFVYVVMGLSQTVANQQTRSAHMHFSNGDQEKSILCLNAKYYFFTGSSALPHRNLKNK